jgi:hypothetical protein
MLVLAVLWRTHAVQLSGEVKMLHLVPRKRMHAPTNSPSIVFQQIANLLLTSILGANVQPSVTIRLPALPHVTRHFLCVRLTLPIEKRYNFPRLGQNFPFWVAVYMVIDVGLLTRTIMPNNYKRATQTLSAPFLMQHGSYDSPEKTGTFYVQVVFKVFLLYYWGLQFLKPYPVWKILITPYPAWITVFWKKYQKVDFEILKFWKVLWFILSTWRS